MTKRKLPSVLDELDKNMVNTTSPQSRRKSTATIAAAQQEAQQNVLGQIEADHVLAMAEKDKTIKDLQEEVRLLTNARDSLADQVARLNTRLNGTASIVARAFNLAHEAGAVVNALRRHRWYSQLNAQDLAARLNAAANNFNLAYESKDLPPAGDGNIPGLARQSNNLERARQQYTGHRP